MILGSFTQRVIKDERNFFLYQEPYNLQGIYTQTLEPILNQNQKLSVYVICYTYNNLLLSLVTSSFTLNLNNV